MYGIIFLPTATGYNLEHQKCHIELLLPWVSFISPSFGAWQIYIPLMKMECRTSLVKSSSRGKCANDHYYFSQATSKWYHISSPIEVKKMPKTVYPRRLLYLIGIIKRVHPIVFCTLVLLQTSWPSLHKVVLQNV